VDLQLPKKAAPPRRKASKPIEPSPSWGGVIRPLILVMIPRVEEARYLVVMKKIKPTPAAYPRRVGIPSRKPL